MTQTHTPGPWHCTKKHPRQISDERGFKIAKCLISTKGANYQLPDGQAEANARLIAAAPELLEALEALRGSVDALISESEGVYGLHLNGDPAPWGELTEGGQFEEWLLSLGKARAAIAKARGA